MPDELARARQAVQDAPQSASALNNLGVILEKFGKFDEAFECFHRAVEVDPNYAIGFHNLALANSDRQQFEKAIACFEKVLRLKPDDLAAHRMLLRLFAHHGEAQKAFDYFQNGYAPVCQDPDDQLALGHAYLTREQFELGLPLLELRLGADYVNAVSGLREVLTNTPEKLRGKTVLLRWEQGYGDTLMFSRYFQNFLVLGARLVVQVQPALKRLFESFSCAALQIVDDAVQVKHFDFYCLIPSLPYVFSSRLHTLALPLAFFDAPLAQKQWAQKMLGVKTKPRVALVWSGNQNPTHSSDHYRSMALEKLLPLLTPEFDFYCLQIQIAPSETALFNTLVATNKMQAPALQCKDFLDTASLCQEMDVVISIDTSMAHLAGTLGIPVWIMLSFDADWRWFRVRSDSPWYPSARLFRQKKMGDWTSVIAEVQTTLYETFAQKTQCLAHNP